MQVSRQSIIQRVLAMVAGIGKHYPTGTQLTIGGSTYTPKALVTALQVLVTVFTGVDNAEASYKAKLASANAQAGPLLILLAAVTAFVRATFGNTPDVLVDFGIAPRKTRKPLTAVEQAAAAAKRDATRKARNTMGSVQKKGVKGTVPTAAPATTASSPATPTVVPTPAATGK